MMDKGRQRDAAASRTIPDRRFPGRRGMALVATGLAMGLLMTALGGARLAAQELRFFRIGTAATTGTYFQIGGVLASAISKPPGARDCDRGGSCGVAGLVAVAQATQGSVENVAAIGEGRLESALVQADVAYWAYSATGIYKGKPAVSQLRAIAGLFPETVHVVVRADSGIRSLADLRSRHVALGEKESGTYVDAKLLLRAVEIGDNDVTAENFRLAQAAEALGAKTVDAFFLLGGYPVPAIAELAAQTPIRLVPVSDDTAQMLIEKYHFLGRTAIPGGVYAGIAGETPSLSMTALWAVSASVPAELVHAITKALWQDSTRKLLEASHPMGRQIKIGTALDGLPIPLHPGAAQFYREQGMTVPDEATAAH